MQDSREMRTIMHFWNGIGVGLPTLAALIPPAMRSRSSMKTRKRSTSTPYDLVGITAMTQQAPRAYEIAACFRERGYMAIGGIHPR